MEKLISDIDGMYSELTAETANDSECKQQTFDFSSIRENFRLHVHNTKNSTTTETVLLDQQTAESLLSLKKKSFELLQNYKNINTKPNPEVKTFSSLDEFVSFVVAQQNILNLEIWKIEAIANYLQQIKLDDQQQFVQSKHDSYGV